MIKIKLLIFIVLFLAAAINANSISVASDYLANDTMMLSAGESKIYSIRLQNPSNSEVGIKIDYDSSFMEVLDFKEVYMLQPKETGYRISFNVTAPENPGVYQVGYTISELEAGGAGLPIRLKINRNVNLKVIENQNKVSSNYSDNNSANNNHSSLIYLALLLIILFFLLKKKRKKNKSSKHK